MNLQRLLNLAPDAGPTTEDEARARVLVNIGTYYNSHDGMMWDARAETKWIWCRFRLFNNGSGSYLQWCPYFLPGSWRSKNSNRKPRTCAFVCASSVALFRNLMVSKANLTTEVLPYASLFSWGSSCQTRRKGKLLPWVSLERVTSHLLLLRLSKVSEHDLLCRLGFGVHCSVS